MSNASLKKVTGILSAQISGKNSFPEGSAETLYADKLPGEQLFPNTKEVKADWVLFPKTTISQELNRI